MPYGLPRYLSGKESACLCRRYTFDPWAGKIPWRSTWQPTPLFLPENHVDRGTWWATVHGVAKSCITPSTHALCHIWYTMCDFNKHSE